MTSSCISQGNISDILYWLFSSFFGLAQEVLLWIKSVVEECGENVSKEDLKNHIWKTLNSGKVVSICSICIIVICGYLVYLTTIKFTRFIVLQITIHSYFCCSSQMLWLYSSAMVRGNNVLSFYCYLHSPLID